jgi:hypothetical protein
MDDTESKQGDKPDSRPVIPSPSAIPLMPANIQQTNLLLQRIPDVAYISFSAEIIPHTTESLLATMCNLTNQGIKPTFPI